MAESARAKFRGENVDEAQRTQDCDTIDRWAEAEGVDLEGEARRTKQKLRSVDRAQT
jgi:hypothetical protein